jgi:cytochrome bd ubiquinol oxidase subunit I
LDVQKKRVVACLRPFDGARRRQKAIHVHRRGTAILFAVGAVSGTVLSFEIGLLWPGFMAQAGAIIGMPFSLEGFAFFTEAIFIGLYLYGWERLAPRAHLTAGVLVAVSGALSGIFVVIANAWMKTPTGLVVAGIHALRLLPDPRNAFHRQALVVALLVGAPAAVLQPLSGNLCARVVACCHWSLRETFRRHG